MSPSFAGTVTFDVISTVGSQCASPDTRFLYYAKSEDPRLWRMPLEGGEETLVFDKLGISASWNWALTREGVYFVNDNFSPNGRIEFFNFITHTITPIFTLEKPATFYGGPTLSSLS